MAPENTPGDMNKERFAAIVEAYGAEARRWPEAERDAAQTFVNSYPQIAAPILNEARALDAALDTDVAPSHINDLLAARINASFKMQRAALEWRPLAALAACAVFGLIAGFSVGHSAPSAQPAHTMAQLDEDAAAEAVIDAAFAHGGVDDDAAGDGG